MMDTKSKNLDNSCGYITKSKFHQNLGNLANAWMRLVTSFTRVTIASVVGKYHNGLEYEVEVKKEKQLRCHNQLRLIHSVTSEALKGIPPFTLPDYFEFVDSLPSQSVFSNASRTQAAKGEHQDQVIRISRLTKRNVMNNTIFLMQNRLL